MEYSYRLIGATLLIGACSLIAGPQLLIEPNPLDLGTITDRENPFPMAFSIHNTGNEVLKILEVKPGCGCTEAKSEKDELKPGEACKVTASFRPGHFEGRVQKSITIKTNDPEHPTSFMSFKAKLPFTDTGLRLTPKFREFRANFTSNTEVKVNIGIENCDEIGAATVLKIDLPDGWKLDKMTTLPRVIEPEQRQFFYIVREGDITTEVHDLPVVFHTDHPKSPQISALIGYVPPPPRVAPAPAK